MYRDEWNAEHLYYVCRFTPGGDVNLDYDRHLEGMASSSRQATGRTRKLAVMIIQDAGYPAPDTRVRQRVVEITDAPGFNAITAVVTTNPLIRGVITALNWLRRKRGEEQVFPTTTLGLGWLERSLGELPAMRAAVARLMGAQSF